MADGVFDPNDEIQEEYFMLDYTHEEIEALFDKINDGFMLNEAQYKKLIEEIGLENISTFSGKYDELEGAPTIPGRMSDLENDMQFQSANVLNDKLVVLNDAVDTKIEKAYGIVPLGEILAMMEEVRGAQNAGTIESVEENKEVVCNAIADFKGLVYNKPLGTNFDEVDLSGIYVVVELPDNPMYAQVDKGLIVDGKEVQQVVKMSVGNNNHIEMNQYEVEGNQMKLSMPTILFAEDPNFTVEAEGFKNETFKVDIPDMTKPRIEVVKGKHKNSNKFELIKINDNEYSVQINEKLDPETWSNGKGMMMLLFRFLDEEGNNILVAGDTFITSKTYENKIAESFGLTSCDYMYGYEEDAKQYCLGLYQGVSDKELDLHYKAILVGAEYKCMDLVIHIPAALEEVEE